MLDVYALVLGGLAFPIILGWLTWITKTTMANQTRIAGLEKDTRALGRSLDQLRDTVGERNGSGNLMEIVTKLLERDDDR